MQCINATPTTINKLVPPKKLAKLLVTPKRTINAGSIATIASAIEPGSVILVNTLSIKSSIFSGRIPGINPPCFLHIICNILWVKYNGSIKVRKENN